MKKIMFGLAAIAAATSLAAIESANVVGYQTQGYGHDGYNICAATFTSVGEKALTLGDLKAGEDFCESMICFLTKTGANAKTDFGGKKVNLSYVYWTEDDEPSDGAGWYLYADEDATINCNSVELPYGDGFLVFRMASEADATLTFAGQVSTDPVTKGFATDGYTPCGNCTPTAIKIGDITPNEDFCESMICFMTKTGANAKTTFGGKTVNKSYVYWTADDDPSDGAGWYLYADEDATVNCNELVTLEAGEGFMVFRMASEPDAEITIPSAL